ncbi:conserved hypothetical protein [Rhodobacteraceae bacterium HTCC2083]|nr:conserved hypothetical protein [Rhodobacteraceae bacterium HTCC2083]
MKRKLNSTEVIDALTDLFILRGVPAYIRPHNGSGLTTTSDPTWASAASHPQ